MQVMSHLYFAPLSLPERDNCERVSRARISLYDDLGCPADPGAGVVRFRQGRMELDDGQKDARNRSRTSHRDTARQGEPTGASAWSSLSQLSSSPAAILNDTSRQTATGFPQPWKLSRGILFPPAVSVAGPGADPGRPIDRMTPGRRQAITWTVQPGGKQRSPADAALRGTTVEGARVYLASQQTETDGDARPSGVPMRISLVSPGFPPQLGGVEVVVGNLGDELHGHGHQVTVYAQRPRGSSFPASPDYPVRRFADWSGSRQFPVAPGLARALWRDRGLFDVIHAHSFHAVPAMMAATVPNVPLVFTPHFHAVGHTRAASALHIVYDPLAALLFRRADKVTCVSVAESELLLRRYPAVESRLSIIPLGVDTQALLAAEPFETDRPVVLVAGRLEPYKRVEHGHPGIRGYAHGRTTDCLRNRFSPASPRAPYPGAGDRGQRLIPGPGQRR